MSATQHRRSALHKLILPVALVGAVVFQLAQGLAYQRRITPYKASYWLVTYEFGFTRRGFAGEVMRWFTGTAPSLVTIEIVQYGVTSLLVVLLLLVARIAWRRNEEKLDHAVVVLCCSPFVFDFVAFQRRPDQVGYASVVALGLLLYRYPQRRTFVAAAGGALLALSVAVSDSAFLACVAWALAIVLLVPGETLRSIRTWFRLALVAVPPAAMAVVSATAGRLDDTQVRSLGATAAKYHWTDVVVFPYLADTLGESVDRVADMQRTMMLGSIAVGVVLLVTQGWLMLGLRWPLRATATPYRHQTTLPVLASVLGLVLLLLLGIDWFRWISGFGLMATVTFAFAMLLRPQQPRVHERSGPSGGTLIVGGYLLAVAAFPNMISVSEGFLQLLLAYNSAKP